MKRLFAWAALAAFTGLSLPIIVVQSYAQSINSGTVTGTVTDPSGSVVAAATVEIGNAITGYHQTTVTDANGVFRLNNVPFNGYRLTATHAGFSAAMQNVEVRSTVPVTVNLGLPVAGVSTTVTVEAAGSVIETEPSAHSDVDMSTLNRLPITMAGSGLSEAVTMMAPGVVNDSNGFFHPLGDHASYSMRLDGQPINDEPQVYVTTNGGLTLAGAEALALTLLATYEEATD